MFSTTRQDLATWMAVFGVPAAEHRTEQSGSTGSTTHPPDETKPPNDGRRGRSDGFDDPAKAVSNE